MSSSAFSGVFTSACFAIFYAVSPAGCVSIQCVKRHRYRSADGQGDSSKDGLCSSLLCSSPIGTEFEVGGKGQREEFTPAPFAVPAAAVGTIAGNAAAAAAAAVTCGLQVQTE